MPLRLDEEHDISGMHRRRFRAAACLAADMSMPPIDEPPALKLAHRRCRYRHYCARRYSLCRPIARRDAERFDADAAYCARALCRLPRLLVRFASLPNSGYA